MQSEPRSNAKPSPDPKYHSARYPIIIHIYIPDDNNIVTTIVYFLSLASDKQSLDFYRSPVAKQSTRSCHTSKTHMIKIYMQVGFIQLLKT